MSNLGHNLTHIHDTSTVMNRILARPVLISTSVSQHMYAVSKKHMKNILFCHRCDSSRGLVSSLYQFFCCHFLRLVESSLINNFKLNGGFSPTDIFFSHILSPATLSKDRPTLSLILFTCSHLLTYDVASLVIYFFLFTPSDLKRKNDDFRNCWLTFR